MYVSAQTFSVGLAGAYGDDIENFGINARAYINSNNHRFCIGPEFTYFFQDTRVDGDDREEVNLFEVNFNGHYIFELTKKLGFYPLTGLNSARKKKKSTTKGSWKRAKPCANLAGMWGEAFIIFLAIVSSVLPNMTT